MSEYLANSLAWSFVGLFPGIALGYVAAKFEAKVRDRRNNDHS